MKPHSICIYISHSLIGVLYDTANVSFSKIQKGTNAFLSFRSRKNVSCMTYPDVRIIKCVFRGFQTLLINLILLFHYTEQSSPRTCHLPVTPRTVARRPVRCRHTCINNKLLMLLHGSFATTPYTCNGSIYYFHSNATVDW
jgi:hypothetical protein